MGCMCNEWGDDKGDMVTFQQVMSVPSSLLCTTLVSHTEHSHMHLQSCYVCMCMYVVYVCMYCMYVLYVYVCMYVYVP